MNTAFFLMWIMLCVGLLLLLFMKRRRIIGKIVIFFGRCISIAQYRRCDSPFGNDLVHNADVSVSQYRLSFPFVLELLAVAVGYGVSLPRALSVIGSLLSNALGDAFMCVAKGLLSGVDWDNAWRAAKQDSPEVNDLLSSLEDILEPCWRHGVSPVLRLETSIEEMHRLTREHIERAAGILTVRLLLPTALCFLPSFIAIGIIPIIAALASGMLHS